MEPRIATPQSAVTASSRRSHPGPTDTDSPETFTTAATDPNPGIAVLAPLRPPPFSAPSASLSPSKSQYGHHDDAAAPRPSILHHPDLEAADHHPLSVLPPLTYQPLPRPLTLNALPVEVQLNIVSHLDTFAAIQALRQTCRLWHLLAGPDSLRATIGRRGVRSLLLSTCSKCLAHDAGRTTTLAPLKSDPTYPLSGVCVSCARRAADARLQVGRRVKMASERLHWVCRWCGWPIAPGTEARPLAGNAPSAMDASAPGHLQFHAACRQKYLNVLLLFFLLGWAQLAVGIAGAVMAWKYWRGVQVVFAPTVTSFLLLWICVVVILCRNDRNPKYGVAVTIELIIMCLWIPPLYYVGKVWATEPAATRPPETVSSEVIFGINMFFRLLNLAGSIPLMLRYDKTDHHLPEIPWWRKATNPVVSFLIYWTYPSSLERKYPPDWL